MTRFNVGTIALAVFVATASAILVFGPASAGDDATQSGTTDAAQMARGAKAYVENCQRCHNYRDPKEFSDRRWDVIVDHMRVIAPLPGNVARDIKVFLKASN